ncbi:MAG: hypothetical protein KDD63_04200, partial [Bacteroidetes bacterium]|nr:hypothetical protein [Bacteroidota bacterium]
MLVPLRLNCLNLSHNLSSIKQNPYVRQDSKKFIWIGSVNGLNRFDGTNVRVYRPAHAESNSDPHISSQIFEDQNGKIWFTTYTGGLHYIDPQTDSVKTLSLTGSDSFSIKSDYYAFHLDLKSRLWLVANGWVHLYDVINERDSLLHPIETFSCYPILDNTGNVKGLVNALVTKQAGIEIISYMGQDTIVSTYFTGENRAVFPKARVLFLHVDGDSVLWLPTDIGLIQFFLNRPEEYVIHYSENPKEFTNLWDIAPYQKDYLWLCSASHGLFLFDKLSGELIRNDTLAMLNEQVIDIHRIHNVYIDRDENLWLSSWEEGIYFVNPENTKFQVLSPKLPGKIKSQFKVNSFCQDGKGNIWCTTPDEGIFVFNDKLELKNHITEILEYSLLKEGQRLVYIFADQQK